MQCSIAYCKNCTFIIVNNFRSKGLLNLQNFPYVIHIVDLLISCLREFFLEVFRDFVQKIYFVLLFKYKMNIQDCCEVYEMSLSLNESEWTSMSNV